MISETIKQEAGEVVERIERNSDVDWIPMRAIKKQLPYEEKIIKEALDELREENFVVANIQGYQVTEKWRRKRM